jgi:hypothetical protein
MRQATRVVAVLLLGLVLGIGGTRGAQAVTDESVSRTEFLLEAREGLAEEWGGAYAECVQEPPDELLLAEPAELRRGCRRKANAILPRGGTD